MTVFFIFCNRGRKLLRIILALLFIGMTYVIVLSEHENKTTKYIIGHKYSTCHVGRFEKALLEVAAVIKLLQVLGMSSIWFRSEIPVQKAISRTWNWSLLL